MWATLPTLLLVALAAAVGSQVACTLELDMSIACGDGYVDEEAGEECDPAVPDSFIDACRFTSRREGEGGCDPVTCRIIDDAEQCAVCGDGQADVFAGEECDGDSFAGQSLCDGGAGVLQCTADCRKDYSACRKCGNGMVDPGEECDPNIDGGDLTDGIPSCSELESPFGPAKPYTAGTPSTCGEDCRWERTRCSYCGNGRVEGSVPLDFQGSQTIAEWCDGGEFDPDILDRELGSSACSQANANTRPIVECADNCLDFTPVDLEQPCCLKTGAACPTLSPLRCCFEVDHPDSTLSPCQVVVLEDGTNFSEVCR